MKLTEAGKKIFDSPFHPDRMYPDPRQEYVYEEMGIKNSGITIGQYAAVQLASRDIKIELYAEKGTPELEAALIKQVVEKAVNEPAIQAIALCNQLAEVEGK